LIQCKAYEPLVPLFESLVPLLPPTGPALRRALVQPAMKCGYRFEDDELVEEMLAEVEGERGALPLLAFAMSRLWEKRDRENGLLTRQAYHDIGGVGGALARHAEATIDRIGAERIPIVRELFRNLMTAGGTRAVREWDELLTVFDELQRPSAEDVLSELVDVRLLTSYKVHGEDREPTRRVEIIHESLLANWPRLVRWQTQDADAVQLRDQLRQAAGTWEEHRRSDDMLWTGTAYREYASWREHYPGGLTETEAAFGDAMTALVGRRHRRRRIAVTAVIVVLVIGLTAVGSLWRQSVRETRRADAANLLSRAQSELESYPSAAVAYATASLELSDSPEARLLALRALWKGPTAFVVNEEQSWEIVFSPDGRFLAQATDAPPPRPHYVIGADGVIRALDDVYDDRVGLRMDPESGIFATIPWGNAEPWALWSAPGKRLLAKGRPGQHQNINGFVVAFDSMRKRVLLIAWEDDQYFVDVLKFDGSSERLGTLPFALGSAARCSNAPGGRWFAVSDGRDVYVIEFGVHDLSEPRRLERIKGPVAGIECDPLGGFVAARSEDGLIRLWDFDGASPPRVIRGPVGVTGVRITNDGSLLEAVKQDEESVETWIWSLEDEEPTLLRHSDLGKRGGAGGWKLNPFDRQIVSIVNPDSKTRLWPLWAPADAEPVIMQRGDAGVLFRLAFHPLGRWLATSGSIGLTLWSVGRPYPMVIKRYEERVGDVVFGPGGRWLATSTLNRSGAVRIWELDGDVCPPARLLSEARAHAYGIAASPDGQKILLGDHSKTIKLLSVSGEAPVELPGIVETAWGVAFSANGRYAAAGGRGENSVTRVIRVWDLGSYEEVTAIDLVDVEFAVRLRFTEDDHLLSGYSSGLFSWDLETGESEVLFSEPVDRFAMNSDETLVLLSQPDTATFPVSGRVALLDLQSGSKTPLRSHGERVTAVGMNEEGTIAVTGDLDGIIRVGPITGGEPHLLLGNSDEIWDLAVDPRGRWIASASGTEIRLWPIPDLSRPPLHTLPRGELIARLKTLTNLRIVRDEESSIGWKLTHDPFPGWETVPTW
jgi:WD40 repeat protein